GWLCRPGWVVDRGQVAGLVGVPAGVEGVGDALLHGRGDVAVDAADAGQAMAESFGLGDLGDVVFDQPRLVGVPQIVEVHAGDHRRDAVFRISCDGRGPGAAGEVGAA